MEQIECSTILWNKIKKFAYTDQAAGVTDRPEVVEDAAEEEVSVIEMPKKIELLTTEP